MKCLNPGGEFERVDFLLPGTSISGPEKLELQSKAQKIGYDRIQLSSGRDFQWGSPKRK